MLHLFLVLFHLITPTHSLRACAVEHVRHVDYRPYQKHVVHGQRVTARCVSRDQGLTVVSANCHDGTAIAAIDLIQTCAEPPPTIHRRGKRGAASAGVLGDTAAVAETAAVLAADDCYKPGWRYVNGVFRRVQGVSTVHRCKNTCLSYFGCLGFTYQPRQLQCTLHNDRVYENAGVQPTDSGTVSALIACFRAKGIFDMLGVGLGSMVADFKLAGDDIVTTGCALQPPKGVAILRKLEKVQVGDSVVAHCSTSPDNSVVLTCTHDSAIALQDYPDCAEDMSVSSLLAEETVNSDLCLLFGYGFSESPLDVLREGEWGVQDCVQACSREQDRLCNAITFVEARGECQLYNIPTGSQPTQDLNLVENLGYSALMECYNGGPVDIGSEIPQNDPCLLHGYGFSAVPLDIIEDKQYKMQDCVHACEGLPDTCNAVTYTEKTGECLLYNLDQDYEPVLVQYLVENRGVSLLMQCHTDGQEESNKGSDDSDGNEGIDNDAGEEQGSEACGKDIRYGYPDFIKSFPANSLSGCMGLCDRLSPARCKGVTYVSEYSFCMLFSSTRTVQRISSAIGAVSAAGGCLTENIQSALLGDDYDVDDMGSASKCVKKDVMYNWSGWIGSCPTCKTMKACIDKCPQTNGCKGVSFIAAYSKECHLFSYTRAKITYPLTYLASAVSLDCYEKADEEDYDEKNEKHDENEWEDPTCEDKSEHCEYFKSMGSCSSDNMYFEDMTKRCKKTCGICSGGESKSSSTAEDPNCKDKSAKCGSWDDKGMCESNNRYRSFMMKRCKKSCGMCEGKLSSVYGGGYVGWSGGSDSYDDGIGACINERRNCQEMAEGGQCVRGERYNAFMQTFCKKACGFCVPEEEVCMDEKEKKCGIWKDSGYCNPYHKYFMYMEKRCMKTCGICGGDERIFSTFDYDIQISSSLDDVDLEIEDELAADDNPVEFAADVEDDLFDQELEFISEEEELIDEYLKLSDDNDSDNLIGVMKAFEGAMEEDTCKMSKVGYSDGFMSCPSRKITAFEECKKECSKTKGCVAFTEVAKYSKCFLYNAMRTEVSESSWTAKECGVSAEMECYLDADSDRSENNDDENIIDVFEDPEELELDDEIPEDMIDVFEDPEELELEKLELDDHDEIPEDMIDVFEDPEEFDEDSDHDAYEEGPNEDMSRCYLPNYVWPGGVFRRQKSDSLATCTSDCLARSSCKSVSFFASGEGGVCLLRNKRASPEPRLKTNKKDLVSVHMDCLRKYNDAGNVGAAGIGADSGCVDNSRSCSLFKTRGFCDAKSGYYSLMKGACQKTCGFCEVQVACEDTSRSCSYYKVRGFCDAKSRYYTYYNVKGKCGKTCGFCGQEQGSCNDLKRDLCIQHRVKERGFCLPSSKNYGVVSANCKNTCGLCGDADKAAADKAAADKAAADKAAAEKAAAEKAAAEKAAAEKAAAEKAAAEKAAAEKAARPCELEIPAGVMLSPAVSFLPINGTAIMFCATPPTQPRIVKCEEPDFITEDDYPKCSEDDGYGDDIDDEEQKEGDCYNYGVIFPGGVIEFKLEVRSVSECLRLCDEDESCAAFTLVQKNDMCILRDGDYGRPESESALAKHGDVVSATLNCLADSYIFDKVDVFD